MAAEVFLSAVAGTRVGAGDLVGQAGTWRFSQGICNLG